MLKRLCGWMVLALMLAPGARGASFEAGPGMRFESMTVYLRDAQGMYFQTQLQETQAVLGAVYTEGPWRASLSGAWADWNPGGVWEGTHLENTAMDPFFWEWRQEVEFSVAYKIWQGLSAGIGVFDSSLRHYRSDDQFTYLQWRSRGCEGALQYAFFRGAGWEASVRASYAPYASLEIYQNTNVEDWYPAIHRIDFSGTGTRVGGALQVSYHHPIGLGLNLNYEQGFSRFPGSNGVDEVALRFGRISGYLAFSF